MGTCRMGNKICHYFTASVMVSHSAMKLIRDTSGNAN